MPSSCRWQAALLVGIMLAGCSSPPPPGGPRVKTYPVTGIVQVDGQPTSGVMITFHPQANAAIKTQAYANTGDGGKFAATTYQAGDGLPEGTYKMTFVLNDESKSTGNGFQDAVVDDRLKGAYADPAKSTIEVKVDKSGKKDLGTIELSTQGLAK